MEENRHISLAEKLQIIHIATPWLRRPSTTKCGLHKVTLFHKTTICNGRKKQLYKGKTWQTVLQVSGSKRTSTLIRHTDRTRGHWRALSVASLSKTHFLKPNHEENRHIPIRNHVHNSWAVIPKLPGSSKTRKVWEIITTKKSLRRFDF